MTFPLVLGDAGDSLGKPSIFLLFTFCIACIIPASNNDSSSSSDGPDLVALGVEFAIPPLLGETPREPELEGVSLYALLDDEEDVSSDALDELACRELGIAKLLVFVSLRARGLALKAPEGPIVDARTSRTESRTILASASSSAPPCE